jgi:hypothetical protein
MKASHVAVCALIAAPLAFFAWSTTRPNYRELRLQDGTVVLGSNHGVWWIERTFFSVRLEDAPHGAPLRSPARLSFGGRELVLRDITPSDLDGLGFEFSPNYPPPERRASVGFGDQNRDGSLEFAFSGERLKAVYARCHVEAACPYELSWPDRPPFRLPIREGRASTLLGPAASVRDFYGH